MAKAKQATAAPAWRVRAGVGSLNHNGVVIPEGGTVELTDDEAAAMAGLVELAATATEQTETTEGE